MSAWYIQDTRTIVGNSMSWWAIDGKGYAILTARDTEVKQ